MLSLHKKKRIAITAVVVAVLILPAVTFAIHKIITSSDTFAITYEMPAGYTAITDPNFYDCVVDVYKTAHPATEIPETGITDEQLETIDTLVCNSRAEGEKITDTTGLEKMPRMAYLDLSSNSIEEIDVSDFNLLTYLNLHSNQLDSIDVSNNTLLTNLYLNNNQLETVNLENNDKLRELDISDNDLLFLDLSNNPALRLLRLSNNQLSYLNIANNTTLTTLTVDGNASLNSLVVENNAQLRNLISDNIMLYADIMPTIDNENYVYDLSGLQFLKDGEHDGFNVEFAIENTASYTFDKTNYLLTVNDHDGAGEYIQIIGTDNRNSGFFSYKFALPYILEYNRNDGDGIFRSFICYSNGSANGCSLNVPDDAPVRRGYHFLGWADNANATSASVQPGGEYTLTENGELYAIWTPIRTLYYDANGGDNAPEAQTCHANDTVSGCTITISTTEATKDGAIFAGWGEQASSTSASYNSGDPITLSGDTVEKTLYAVFASNYTLSYNANGGSTAPASQTCQEIAGGGCNVEVSFDALTRDGYHFLGWGESADATSIAYAGGQNITLNSNKTLFAIWAPIRTLSYDGNGVSFAPVAQTCHANDTISECSVVVSNSDMARDGYHFLGWGESADATTAVYIGEQNIALNSDKTLFAIWAPIRTLSYDVTGGENAPSPDTCFANDTISGCTLTVAQVEPTKEGFDFLGWARSDTATTAEYVAGDSITINDNTILYAIWGEIHDDEPGGDTPGGDEPGDDIPGDDTPSDDAPADDGADDGKIVVPDTSAPETGANTMALDGGSAMTMITSIGAIISVTAFVMIYRNKQDN